jgi:hypothetical protein
MTIHHVRCSDVRDSNQVRVDLGRQLACHYTLHPDELSIESVQCSDTVGQAPNATFVSQITVSILSKTKNAIPPSTASDQVSNTHGIGTATIHSIETIPDLLEDEDSGTDYRLIGGVIGGLVGAGFLAFAVHRRRKNAASETTTVSKPAIVQFSDTNGQGQKAVVPAESGPLLI